MSGPGVVIDRVTVEASFVPVPLPGVVAQPVGSELVFLGALTAQSTALNPVGSVIWQCFDGSSRLDEIALDVAEAFEVTVETATADLELLATQLHLRGLITFAHLEVPAPSASPTPTDESTTLLPEPPEP